MVSTFIETIPRPERFLLRPYHIVQVLTESVQIFRIFCGLSGNLVWYDGGLSVTHHRNTSKSNQIYCDDVRMRARGKNFLTLTE